MNHIITLGVVSFFSLMLFQCIHWYSKGAKTKAIIALGLTLGAIITFSILWIKIADPFCWSGYIAYDGLCAWE